MKTIQNLKTGISDAKNYFELIKICINVPLREGMDIDTMRRKLNVLNMVSQEADECHFEDQDFNTIKDAVSSMKWPIAHNDIVTFSDYIMGL